MTTDESDPAAVAQRIIDANLYMVLATADSSGGPWATPVYYAALQYTVFYWVSDPDAQHSRNIAARPEVGIVVFDSSAPISTGQAVYLRAAAQQVTGQARANAIDTFSQRSIEHGGRPWSIADIEPPGRLRLYQATAQQHYILDDRDRRIPVVV